jgi:two-component system, sensor histidine kinase YesM
MIFPIYMLGLSIFNWGYRMIEEGISNSIMSQVEFYMGNLESEIRRIRSLQYECMNDENLVYLVNASRIMKDYEKTRAMLLVHNRLSIMKNSSSYIENVSVHIPVVNKTIAAVEGVTELVENWDEVPAELADVNKSGVIYWNNNMFLKVEHYANIERVSEFPEYVMERDSTRVVTHC